MPSVGAKLRIRVMDEDFGKADDEVGTFLVPFDPVLKEEVAEVRWFHLYGLGEKAEETAKASAATTVLKGGSVGLRRQLKDNAKFYSSEWRGKLQLRLCVTAADDPDVVKDASQPLPERLLKRALRPLPPEPPTKRYELRAAVLMGSDLGGLSDDDVKVDGMFVEVALEAHRYRSRAPVVVAPGLASFLAPADAEVDDDGQFEGRAAELERSSARGELLSTATPPVTEEVRLARQEGHVGGRSASQSMKEQKEHERQPKGRGFSRSLFSGKAKVGDSAMAPLLGGGGGGDGDSDGLPPGVCTELVHGLRRPLDLPEDPEQLPQTIVYLCEKSGRRVGFLPSTRPCSSRTRTSKGFSSSRGG